MIKWPSIEQYRNVVKNVTQKARYKGKDENGDAIFDPFVKLPKLRFEGTVKLHGTNAAVAVGNGTGLWFQSRENIITPEKDNAGFATFAWGKQDMWYDIAGAALNINPTMTEYDILIFGEWCGGNIQASVAITGLPKMFVIFGIAFVDAEGEKTYLTRDEVVAAVHGYVSVAGIGCPTDSNNVYCIYDFEQYVMDIDFEQPHEYQNGLNEITERVEAQCPVGLEFGSKGVGEGVVWRCITAGYEDSGFWFKVKGEAHSKSKVKTLANVDVERINNINELAAKLANDGRLAQGVQTVFDTLNGGEVDIKRTGEFIKWVMSDVFKEETDTIVASGFTGKELNGPISKLARDYLMQNLEL
jgi:hypothetical protein